MIVPLRLAGIKDGLEAENSMEALEYIRKIAETEESFLILIASKFAQKLHEEIREIRERNESGIVYEIEEGGLRWRQEL